MASRSHQFVGSIELVPANDPDGWPLDDETLETAFARLAGSEPRSEADEWHAGTVGEKSNRIEAMATDTASAADDSSVIYVDTDRLERQLQSEWSRLRCAIGAD